MYMCEHTANQRHSTGHGSHVFRPLFRFIAPTRMCLSRLGTRDSARDSGVGLRSSKEFSISSLLTSMHMYTV